MDQLRNNCSYSDSPVTSINGRNRKGRRGEKWKRRGDEERKTAVRREL